MFVWLNIIGTHKSWKNDDGITSGKFTSSISPLVAAPGILEPKETLATIKRSFYRHKSMPVLGQGEMRNEIHPVDVSACWPTRLFHGNKKLGESI